MLLQVWVTGRRKNTCARSLGLRVKGAGAPRAREWSAKIWSNPCGRAASFCRFVLPLRIHYGFHARNFGTCNRLGFWNAKTLAVLINMRGCQKNKIYRRCTTCLNLPAALRQCAPAIERAGLRNLILSDPAPGERK
jgi:hypothetical protein